MSSQYLLPSRNYYDFVIPSFEERAKYYEMGWHPVDDMMIDGINGVAWGPMRCMDCIAAGGTQERPDFWED